ncbi:MAG: hypothetical protein NT162_02610 [Candidatus Woesebacteria bacterium]|nr:hypothetical protein [Candidatus Woesebacteria bacterium]
MKEKISYSSQEGQEFQGKPHVSLMLSLEFDGTWRVDLRWREDTSSSRIDAEFNFVDGYAPLSAALRDAIWYGDCFNLPVVKYEDTSMIVLKKTGKSIFQRTRPPVAKLNALR